MGGIKYICDVCNEEFNHNDGIIDGSVSRKYKNYNYIDKNTYTSLSFFVGTKGIKTKPGDICDSCIEDVINLFAFNSREPIYYYIEEAPVQDICLSGDKIFVLKEVGRNEDNKVSFISDVINIPKGSTIDSLRMELVRLFYLTRKPPITID